MSIEGSAGSIGVACLPTETDVPGSVPGVDFFQSYQSSVIPTVAFLLISFSLFHFFLYSLIVSHINSSFQLLPLELLCQLYKVNKLCFLSLFAVLSSLEQNMKPVICVSSGGLK